MRDNLFDKDVIACTRMSGQLVTGKPLDLTMRDVQRNSYLQYEFNSVELVSPASHLYAYQILS